MKTPSALILLSIFLVCGNAIPITEIIKKVEEQVPVVILDDGEKAIITDADLLTLVQLITSNTCYFVTDATWPDYLEDFVSVDLRLQLGDWCGRYSEFIVSDEIIIT